MADYFLIVNGAKLPVLVRSRVSGSPVEIGSRAQMIDGTLMREVVGYRDHMWSCELGPFTAAETAAVQRLIQGRGEYWPFDEDLYSAAQLGPLSGAVATIHRAVAADGAPVVDAGRFGGSVAVERASENLFTEDGSRGASQATPYSDAVVTAGSTEAAWEGPESVKVDTTQVAGDGHTKHGVFWMALSPLSQGTTLTFSAYVKAPVGIELVVGSRWRRASDSAFIELESRNYVSDGNWIRVEIPYTLNADASEVGGQITVDGNVATVFYVDGLQIEQVPFATSWMLGGTARNAGSLHYSGDIVRPEQGTIAMWARPFWGNDDTATRLFAAIEESSDLSTKILASTSQVVFRANQAQVTTPRSNLNEQDWNHLAMTWSRDGSVAAYLNGASVGTTTWSTLPEFVTPLHIGTNTPSDQLEANAMIDDLIILPYAATGEQIAAWYETGHPFGPLPRLYVSGRLPDREITDPVLCDGTITGVRVGVEGRYLQVTLEQVRPSV